jgi:drug/metabolite transporter (DMT)-like permease
MPADAWMLALASAFFFGAALILTQFGLRHSSPALGAALSIPCSVLMFWAVAPFALVDGWHPGAAAIFAGVGLLFPATVTLLTFEANRRAGPNVTGAVGNLAPLFAVLLAVVALGEAPGLLQIAGIAAILAGVTIISGDRRRPSDPWPLWVLALPLAAAAIRGFAQPIVSVGLADWPSPFAAVLIGYSVSSLVVIGAVAARARRPFAGVGFHGILWFAGVGLCNGLAVLSLYAALARGPVSLVSPLVATYPLVTLTLSPLLPGGFHIRPAMVAGVAATVGGVALLMVA